MKEAMVKMGLDAANITTMAADVQDAESLREMARRCRVVIACVCCWLGF